MRGNRRNVERGQAAAELALGSLLFVTVLLLGIQMSEVALFAVNLQEATASAMWDSTGARHHRLGAPSDFAPRQTAITGTGGAASTRYANLDGRQGAGSGRKTLLARVGDVQLRCRRAPLLPLNLSGASGLGGVYGGGNGGARCTGRANASAVPGAMPSTFVENEAQGGMFKLPFGGVTGNVRLCGVGRANGGACNAEVRLMLGDWGLGRGAEAAECPLAAGAGCANEAYYEMVRRVFAANGRGQGSDGANLLGLLGVPAAVNENAFYMSFRGSESGYQETVANGRTYTVTPGGPYDAVGEYATTAGSRSPCFLGNDCE